MTYLLDTVTVSELRKGKRMDSSVAKWSRSIDPQPVYLSVVTLNEIRFGIRKVQPTDAAFAAVLVQWYRLLTKQPERIKIVAVDKAIAELAADFRFDFKMGYDDALIAATAHRQKVTLATRNSADFVSSGIRLINPWEG